MNQGNLRAAACALALSMWATPDLVNGQDKSLTSVNRSAHEDSVKGTKADVAKLIEILLKNGSDGVIAENLAPIIGLTKAMPMKAEEIVLSEKGGAIEKRGCYVVYENVDSTSPTGLVKRPVCAYIVKVKRIGLDKQMRYFRIDLDGNLEKVILSKSRYDENGKPVRGSGVKEDQDITSPEVKKTFEAEMKFWLKDWLKKEQKAAAKT